MRRFFSALYQLLTSMRFAVSLLVLIAIACVIGTVLKQNEAYINYEIEFGPFWFTFFEQLGLYDVYHANWFLLIFAFLVGSTCLCIIRHFPGILREIRSFRTHAQERSLRLMAHHVEFPISSTFSQQLETYLRQEGFRFRQIAHDNGRLWAAKKGSWQKLGYLFTHMGIVIICIGGLLDGNIALKWQQIIGNKVAEIRPLSARDMPEHSRLSTQNGSFRAQVSVPEGQAVDFAWIRAGRGAFLQELPFILALQKFRVAYYSTGQPKLFASDVVVQDKRTGQTITGTVKVNHPLVINGIAIYQASFGDGGSGLQLQRWNLDAMEPPQKIQATSLTQMPLPSNQQNYQVEWGELRVLNIENIGHSSSMSAHASVFQDKLREVRSVKAEHHLRNIGPSIQFTLRDSSGIGREYINYMWPFVEEGRAYLLSGMRQSKQEEIRFVRLPLDREKQLTTFMHLRALLLDKYQAKMIVKRMANKALMEGNLPTTRHDQFIALTQMVLDRFQKGGFTSLEKWMDTVKVPLDKRSSIVETYLKILQGAAFEGIEMLAQQQGQHLPVTAETHRFVLDSLVAISQLFDYGAPMYLQLTGFEQVQSSGFQIARAPGKMVVYIGCLFLILGVITMFYIREVRLWVWVQGPNALLAMSSNRKNQALDNAFVIHTNALSTHGQKGQHEA